MTNLDPDGVGEGADDYRELSDLTPRAAKNTATGAKKWVPIAVLGLVIVGLGGIVAQGLVNGTLFFHEVDQAVEERPNLDDERFRMLGIPVEGTVVETTLREEFAVAFTVTFDGVTADVVHIGDPPQLFQPDVPVTLEGRWVNGGAPVDNFVGGVNDGWWFESDTMLVKHDNDYRNDNEERIGEAEERSAEAEERSAEAEERSASE